MTSNRLTRRRILAGAATGLAGVGLVGTAAAGRGRHGRGNGGERSDGTTESRSTDDESSLTDAERAGLLFMREEEKLARDVYLLLSDEWGLTVFDNVAESEQRHVDAMRSLLATYDISDPSPDERGEFENETLQELYDALVARGQASAVEALRVGGLVEETDIVDIAAEIERTDESDIRRVYGNLLDGSENHLRGFVSVLARYGIDYEAQVLDQSDVDEIVEDG